MWMPLRSERDLTSSNKSKTSPRDNKQKLQLLRKANLKIMRNKSRSLSNRRTSREERLMNLKPRKLSLPRAPLPSKRPPPIKRQAKQGNNKNHLKNQDLKARKNLLLLLLLQPRGATRRNSEEYLLILYN